jgi:spore germination protein GerM
MLVGCSLESGGKTTVVPPGSGAVQKPADPVKPVQPVLPVETVAVRVYFGTQDARYLIGETRMLKKGPLLMQQAMEALAAGPFDKELVRVIPQATRVNSIVVRDKTAFVDFSSELVKPGFGGSATEILAVAAIVNTLTGFTEVEQVQILVEGKKVSTLYGHIDVHDPLGRSPAIIKRN